MERTKYPPLPVLIVEDEARDLLSMEINLIAGGIDNLLLCHDSREVRPILGEREICLILLDLKMPHISGFDLLEEITENHPEIPVIVVTGLRDAETAIRCMKRNAHDYLMKPFEDNRLITTVKRAVEYRLLKDENLTLKHKVLTKEVKNPEAFKDIVTVSRKMYSIFQYIEAVAVTEEPVLITGETGVGKELIAGAVHNLSGRQGEYIKINAASYDDEVFFDALFGHIKGAFTGGNFPRRGLVETAAGGTLFLDEIGDLSPNSQMKLLRFIQEREYFQLGSDVPKKTDCRIIASTNKDLHEAIERGRFRKDLYYRLSAHHIHIPPLRERPEDINTIFRYSVHHFARQLGKPIDDIEERIFELLPTYYYEGNVRELMQVTHDIITAHQGEKLRFSDFRERLEQMERVGGEYSEHSAEEYGFESWSRLPKVKEATEMLITEAMRRNGGNQSRTAEMLGISRPTLMRHFKN